MRETYFDISLLYFLSSETTADPLCHIVLVGVLQKTDLECSFFISWPYKQAAGLKEHEKFPFTYKAENVHSANPTSNAVRLETSSSTSLNYNNLCLWHNKLVKAIVLSYSESDSVLEELHLLETPTFE